MTKIDFVSVVVEGPKVSISRHSQQVEPTEIKTWRIFQNVVLMLILIGRQDNLISLTYFLWVT